MPIDRLRAKVFLAVILILLLGAFAIKPILSQLTSLRIPSYGVIGAPTPISALHVEGRYIKDSAGNTVYLRGVNKGGFVDDPGGQWGGVWEWTVQRCLAELDAMQSWGINVIRLPVPIDYWKFNTENHRQRIKDVLTYADERGIYIVYSPRQVLNYNDGGMQDALPYPPYSEGHTNIIANGQEFVDYWVTVAQELKDYSNVIFELWNEPHGNQAAKESWFNVVQQCVDAIRTVTDHIIIIEWDWGVFVNLEYPSSRSDMSWVEQYPISGTNLVYSTHIYRGGYGQLPGGGFGYTYDDIKQAFQLELIDWVGNTLNKPLWIGEIACDLSMANHAERFTNALTILNEWKLGYAAWWWRTGGNYRLNRGWYGEPSEGGQILIDAIAAGSI